MLSSREVSIENLSGRSRKSGLDKSKFGRGAEWDDPVVYSAQKGMAGYMNT